MRLVLHCSWLRHGRTCQRNIYICYLGDLVGKLSASDDSGEDCDDLSHWRVRRVWLRWDLGATGALRILLYFLEVAEHQRTLLRAESTQSIRSMHIARVPPGWTGHWEGCQL